MLCLVTTVKVLKKNVKQYKFLMFYRLVRILFKKINIQNLCILKLLIFISIS